MLIIFFVLSQTLDTHRVRLPEEAWAWLLEDVFQKCMQIQLCNYVLIKSVTDQLYIRVIYTSSAEPCILGWHRKHS